MDNKELQKMVEEISIVFFQKPFCHQASFNPRLRTTGGRYLLKNNNIEINKSYYEMFGEKELTGIIKHELCHYHLHLEGKGYQHKDQEFKRLLKLVDAPRFCTPIADRKKRRSVKKILVYTCQACSQIYIRKRTVNTTKYRCGKCKGQLVKIKELIEG